MATINVNKIGGLSPEQLEVLRGMGEDAITSLRNDMSSTDEKLRSAARRELFSMGIFSVQESNRGVVELLLDRARKGDFGRKAAIYAKESSADEGHVDFIPGSAVEDDDPDTVRVTEVPVVVPAIAKPLPEKAPITMNVTPEPEVVEEDTNTRENLRMKLLGRHSG